MNGGTTHKDEEYRGMLLGQWLCTLWASQRCACIFGVQSWKKVISPCSHRFVNSQKLVRLTKGSVESQKNNGQEIDMRNNNSV